MRDDLRPRSRTEALRWLLITGCAVGCLIGLAAIMWPG